ncbi:MAG TPA: hypothetical protein VGD78_15430 [Chthoniobacterales bacterium]
MDVLISADPFRATAALARANLKAGNAIPRTQPSGASLAVPADAALVERAIMARLLQIAWSGTVSVTAAIFTTVIDWTVIGWRDFWLTVCVAAFVAFLTFVGRLIGDLDGREVHQSINP